MVLQEGTGQKNSDRRGNPIAAAAAGVVAVIVVFGLFALTEPEPQLLTAQTTIPEAQTPTTESPFAPYVLGETVRPNLAFSFLGLPPIATIDHQGEVLVFTPSRLDADGEPTGLRMHKSRFSGVGQVTTIGAGLSVHAISATDETLVAAGIERAGRSPWVGTSVDGLEWAVRPLPEHWGSARRFDQVELLVDGNTFIIAGSSHEELKPEGLEDAIEGFLGIEELRTGYHLDWNRVVIEAPLGMVAAVIDVEDLGWSPEDFDYVEVRSAAWASIDAGTSWLVTDFGENWLHDLHLGEAGPTMVVAGEDPPRFMVLTRDGSWFENDLRLSDHFDMRMWGGGWVGRHQWRDQISIKTDDEWTAIEPDVFLPESEAHWWFEEVEGGPGGIAIVAREPAHGWDSPPPFSLNRDGYELSIAETRAELQLTRNGEVISAVAMWDETPEQYIAFDVEKRAMTFLDPVDNTPLVTFGFDEIEAEETRRHMEVWAGSDSRTILLLSPDANTWHVTELDSGDRSPSIIDVDVLEDAVLVTLAGGEGWDSPDRRPVSIEVWTVPLPQTSAESGG